MIGKFLAVGSLAALTSASEITKEESVVKGMVNPYAGFYLHQKLLNRSYKA